MLWSEFTLSKLIAFEYLEYKQFIQHIKINLGGKYTLLTDSNKITYQVKDDIEVKKLQMFSSGTPPLHPGISIATAVAVNSYFSLSSYF